MTSDRRDPLPRRPDSAGDRRTGAGGDLSSLWHLLSARPWTSLAVISPDDPAKAWRLAQRLVDGLGQTPNRTVKAVNVLDLNQERARVIAQALSPGALEPSGKRMRFVLAVDTPLDNAIALGVVGKSDAVLLLLEKGRSRIPDARRTIELVGRDRLIGAVLG